MRRANDAYYTPAWMTRALLANVPEIGGQIIEPCAGDLSIARVLRDEGRLDVYTNDIDTTCDTDSYFDATEGAFWVLMAPDCDWVISNTPYTMPACLEIVDFAIKVAKVGVAMMLRISFKEPTQLRGPFLEANPLSRMLVMPRYSFTGNGKSDSATTAWMIWSKVPLSGPPMLSLYRADDKYAEPALAKVGESR